MEHTVIVGAGPAGLALAYRLKRLGIMYRHVDESDCIGSPWRSRHPQLRLNTLRIFSHQPGMRIPRRCGRWVSRHDYVRYLEQYCERFGLHVELGTQVTSVTRSDGGWHLDTNRGSIETRNVVISTGGFRIPRMPAIAGLEFYAGIVRHARDVGDMAAYDGLRVLVIGGGNSGFDVANNLARRPLRDLAMSVRTPPSVVPRDVLGVPTHLLSVLGRSMPLSMQNRTLKMITRMFLPDLERLGIPQSSEGAFTRHARDMVTVAVDDGFLTAVRAGAARIVPEIVAFEDGGVITVRGERLEPDAVICATGYSPALEPLVGHLGILDRFGLPTTNGAQENAVHPGLWFLGLRGFIWGNMHEQRRMSLHLAREIARS